MTESDQFTIELEKTQKEIEYMGSFNHSLVQAQLSALLLSTYCKFSVFIELSLDMSQIDLSQFNIKAKEELKPDICLYSRNSQNAKVKKHDIIRISEMPLLAIEIVSPRQSIDEIIAKFEVYFFLGVKSCWLIIPTLEAIDIYSNFEQHKIFDSNNTEIIDKNLDIHLPIQKIFAW
ncbi:hypothetical protein TI05_14475 [Achromatium sp. WMS3]|nr:hypothetical protein TI05_14475 [Achromatium sp. WMS3]